MHCDVHLLVARRDGTHLADESSTRPIVVACTRAHLADVLAGGGLDATTAECLAGEVVASVALESLLAALSSALVTAEVQAAVDAAAASCSPAPPG